jgi:hypothetical protein
MRAKLRAAGREVERYRLETVGLRSGLRDTQIQLPQCRQTLSDLTYAAGRVEVLSEVLMPDPSPALERLLVLPSFRIALGKARLLLARGGS